MAVVGFFSMWILNLALVSMMLPIVSALVDQLAASDKDASPDYENQSCQDIPIEDLSLKADDAGDGMKRENSTFPREDHIVKRTANLTETCISKEPTYSNEDLKTCFNLGLIYSTTIGGAGSMVGTVTQILMNTYLEIYYGPEAKVNFGDWVLFSAPNQLVSLILGWAWLSLFYLDLKTSLVRCCRRKAKATKKTGIVRILRREYEKLGPIKWAEKMIIVVFLVLIVIWFFEDPNFMPGWSSWFMPGYVQVSTVTAGVALICYALPAEKPSINIRDDRKPYVGLLEWKSSESSVPWGIVLYLGGLLSTVQAMKVTGLTSSIEDQFAPLKELSPWLVMLIVTVVCSILTEFMTSSVIIAIVIPVLTQTALAHGIHPYYLVMSMTLSINFAFCLPAGSLVNALVISFESVTTFQMIKTGVMMNVICLTVVNISMNTYGWWLLGLDEVPDWALAANGTSAG
ncbi:Na(+)/citrate cotransporter-like [Ptychodera flava]|uniref:Na(+)/citrate cotransporter-like n=1 Tax=Ptychodera flava TaxID=63121 RepID=UPI00396A8C2E